MKQRKVKLYYTYKLTKRGYTAREASKYINTRFGKIISEQEVVELCRKYNIVRKGIGKKYNYYEKEHIVKLAVNLYIKFYNSQKVCDYINNKYNMNLTVSIIRKFASKMGKQKILRERAITQSKLSYIEEKQLINDYISGMTMIEVANKYGYKTHNSVANKLLKYNIPIRSKDKTLLNKKSYKDFSFEKIDSDWKAYYLGLLLTDGCIQGTTINLGLIDKDAIKYLCDNINVKYTTRNYKLTNRKTMYQFTIRSRKLIEDIKRLGLVERKTKTLQPPKLYEDEIQYLSFIFKGIIDGDGWIEKNGNGFFISTASGDFAYWCKDILENYFNMANINIRQKYDGFYIIGSSKKNNIEILKNTIYKSSIGMLRKYNRVHKIERCSETIIGTSFIKG